MGQMGHTSITTTRAPLVLKKPYIGPKSIAVNSPTKTHEGGRFPPFAHVFGNLQQYFIVTIANKCFPTLPKYTTGLFAKPSGSMFLRLIDQSQAIILDGGHGNNAIFATYYSSPVIHQNFMKEQSLPQLVLRAY